MIEDIVGSTSAERVLAFLTARESGYATEIARAFETDLSPIQKQLERMERDGLLINQRMGRTLVYRYNPRFPFVPEVQSLMEKVLQRYPKKCRKSCFMIGVAQGKRRSHCETYQKTSTSRVGSLNFQHAQTTWD